MIRSIRDLEPGSKIEADVCIIGGGAAGIVIARELIHSGLSVALFESGGFGRNRAVQNLYAGDSIGERYPWTLDTCRTRRFGGSTNCWGGTCTPLNDIDFAERPWIPWSGWPIGPAELDPYIRSAHAICCSGPYLYDGSAWDAIGLPSRLFESSGFTPFVWNVTNRDRLELSFSKRFGRDLEEARNVCVYLDGNAVELVPDETGSVLERVKLRTLGGLRYEATARSFVLACGGIENPRLLLAMEAYYLRTGDQTLTGRFFHEHLQMPCGILEGAPGSPAARYAEFGRAEAATLLMGLVLNPEIQKEQKTLNVSIAIEPYYHDHNGLFSLKKVKNDLRYGTFNRDTARHLWSAARQAHRVLPDAYRRVVRGEKPRGAPNQFVVFGRSEQSPNPLSRVVLSGERDALGVPRAVLDWRTTPLDRTALRLATSLAVSEFRRLGFGELTLAAWMSGEDWPADIIGGPHHMGTTRMADDPSLGVVDRNCKMHSLDRLYIAGSSVFPTGGHATPTLTIVALAIRLAQHLSANLVRQRPIQIGQSLSGSPSQERAALRGEVSA